MWRPDLPGDLRPTAAVLLAILTLTTLAGTSSAKLCADTKAASLMDLTAKCTQLSTMYSILSNVPAKTVNNMLNCTGKACRTVVRTVFLPSDEAWQNYFAQYGTIVEDLTAGSASAHAALNTLLSNHVIAYTLAPFVAGGPNATFTTLASTTAAPLMLVLKRLSSGQLDILGSFFQAHVLDEGIVLYGNQQFTAYTIDAVLATIAPPSRSSSPTPSPPPPSSPPPNPPPPTPPQPIPSPLPPSPPPRPNRNPSPQANPTEYATATWCTLGNSSSCPSGQLCVRLSFGFMNGSTNTDSEEVPVCVVAPAGATICNNSDPSPCAAGQTCQPIVMPVTVPGQASRTNVSTSACLVLAPSVANATFCNPNSATSSGCSADELCRTVYLPYSLPDSSRLDSNVSSPVCVKPLGGGVLTTCAPTDPNSCPSNQWCINTPVKLYVNDFCVDSLPSQPTCLAPDPSVANATVCNPNSTTSGCSAGELCRTVYLPYSLTGSSSVDYYRSPPVCVKPLGGGALTTCSPGDPNSCPSNQWCINMSVKLYVNDFWVDSLPSQPTCLTPSPSCSGGNSTFTTVTVNASTSLASLATTYGTSLAQIMLDNRLSAQTPLQDGQRLTIKCQVGTWSQPYGLWGYGADNNGKVGIPAVAVCAPGQYAVSFYVKPSQWHTAGQWTGSSWVGQVTMTCSDGSVIGVDAQPGSNPGRADDDGTVTQLSGFSSIPLRVGYAIDSMFGVGAQSGAETQFGCPKNSLIVGFSAGASYQQLPKSWISGLQFLCRALPKRAV